MHADKPEKNINAYICIRISADPQTSAYPQSGCPSLFFTQTAVDSGSVVQLQHTRLASGSVVLVLASSSLVVLMIRNATTSARVHKDSNGHSHSTKGKPVMPLLLL